MKSETITLLIALWGALLGTFSVFWQIIKEYKNKGKIKIKANIDFLKGGRRVIEVYAVHINITNTGKTPITIENLCIKTTNNTESVIDDSIKNKRIEVGRIDTFEILDYDFVKDMKTLYAKDSLGKKWFVSNRNIKLIKEEFKNRDEKFIDNKLQ